MIILPDHTKHMRRRRAGLFVSYRNILFLFTLYGATALSGCAVAPPLGEGLAADFRLRGKIGVRDDTGNGTAFSASFDWVQAGSAYAIELWGPFGQGRTRLDGDDSTLTVTDGRGAVLAGESPQALMREHLGWSAPVNVLQHWIRGRPAPGHRANVLDLDADGRAKRFEQLGWTVELSRWRDSVAGPVPGRVRATRQDRRITIVCKEWLFG